MSETFRSTIVQTGKTACGILVPALMREGRVR